MTDDDECIHGLGMVSACVLCNGRAAREAVENADPVVTSAKHTAMCPECDQMIYRHHLIVWFPDSSRPTVHHDCYEP